MKKDIKINQLDPQFKYKIANAPGGESLMNCFACGKCSAVCPISEVNEEFKPRKIIHMILLGMKEEVLSNEFIWLCATCDACSFRCPQKVRMADIMSVVRKIAEDEGYVPSNFNKQMEIVKSFSKLYELNSKYSLWGKIKDTLNKDREKTKEKVSSNYFEEFELCINLALNFIKKNPQSLLLSNVLELIDNRFKLYFADIKDFSKKEDKEEFIRLLAKYENLLEDFASSSLEGLIIKNSNNIVNAYKNLEEKNKLETFLLKISKKFPESKINLKNNEE
ncbi:MAG: 4Fe-4S dicluster domain-containing protein [Candidatus Caldatribacteriota bacterium]|nr:4Fe-4S dicluster domain-containing protein [Candidatus Caldatribacteriota bacterium]